MFWVLGAEWGGEDDDDEDDLLCLAEVCGEVVGGWFGCGGLAAGD